MDKWGEYGLNQYFEQYTLTSRWHLLDSVYDSLNFGYPDALTRIVEYGWICHQLNKYVSRQRTNLGKSLPKIEDTLAALETVISNSAFSIKTGADDKENIGPRAQFVYYYLRDNWLGTLQQAMAEVVMMTTKDDSEKEDEYNGWFDDDE